MHFLSAVSRLCAGRTCSLRLVVAAALGGAVGFERELREREAGLRTHLLVSVGSALFTLVSAYGFHDFLVGDGSAPTRRGSRRRSSPASASSAPARSSARVSPSAGSTTAATLWVVAAIGMAAGAGYYARRAHRDRDRALLARAAPHRRAPGHPPLSARVDRLLVELPAGGSPAPMLEASSAQGGARRARVDAGGDRRSVGVDVDLRGLDRPAIVAGVAEIDGVLEVRWTDEGAILRSRERAQGARARAAAARLDDRAARARTDWPEETGATYVRERAREGAVRARGARPGRWMIGEDSGLEVAALGGRPGHRSPPATRRRAAPAIAKLLGELDGVRDRARALRLASSSARAGRRGAPRHAARSTAGSPTSRAATRASATTRCSSPRARSAPSPSSATTGRSATRIAPARRARCSRRSPRGRPRRVAAGCGGMDRDTKQVLNAFFAGGPIVRSLGGRFPHKPGTLPCVSA